MAPGLFGGRFRSGKGGGDKVDGGMVYRGSENKVRGGMEVMAQKSKGDQNGKGNKFVRKVLPWFKENDAKAASPAVRRSRGKMSVEERKLQISGPRPLAKRKVVTSKENDAYVSISATRRSRGDLEEYKLQISGPRPQAKHTVITSARLNATQSNASVVARQTNAASPRSFGNNVTNAPIERVPEKLQLPTKLRHFDIILSDAELATTIFTQKDNKPEMFWMARIQPFTDRQLRAKNLAPAVRLIRARCLFARGPQYNAFLKDQNKTFAPHVRPDGRRFELEKSLGAKLMRRRAKTLKREYVKEGSFGRARRPAPF